MRRAQSRAPFHTAQEALCALGASFLSGPSSHEIQMRRPLPTPHPLHPPLSSISPGLGNPLI